MTPLLARLGLDGDRMLGLAGFVLAAGSGAFGIGMMLHGPTASFGTSKDFSVFAQLAPRAGGVDRQVLAGRGKLATDELDMTETASIPKADAKRATPTSPRAPGPSTIIKSVTLEAVGSDSATVAFEGRTRVVRIGDDIPGAGQVVAILAGSQPELRTSRGVIVPALD